MKNLQKQNKKLVNELHLSYVALRLLLGLIVILMVVTLYMGYETLRDRKEMEKYFIIPKYSGFYMDMDKTRAIVVFDLKKADHSAVANQVKLFMYDSRIRHTSLQTNIPSQSQSKGGAK